MPTNLLPPTLARWLTDHHGVVTTQELRAAGVGRTATDRLCSGGVLRRVTRGVFVATMAAPTLEHRCPAAVLPASRRLRHGTDGRHAGGPAPPTTVAGSALLDPSRGAPRRGCRRRVSPDHGARARATGRCAPTGSSSPRSRASPSTWPPTCASSTIARWSSSCSTGGCVTADELVAIGRRLCHPARRGSTTFRRTLLGLGGEAHDSHPEVVLHDALRALGVPVDAQVPVRCPADGVTIHVDLAVPAVRWGIELDIHPEHRSVDGHQRGQPPGARPARRGLADRAGLRTRHGRPAAARRRARRAVPPPHPSVRRTPVARFDTRTRFNTRIGRRFTGRLGRTGTSPGRRQVAEVLLPLGAA